MVLLDVCLLVNHCTGKELQQEAVGAEKAYCSKGFQCSMMQVHICSLTTTSFIQKGEGKKKV